MSILQLSDRPVIAGHLLRDRELNIYQLGDLDDFYWPYTRWYAWQPAGQVEAIVLYFTGLSLPTLISLDRTNLAASKSLLARLTGQLPGRFYAHLLPEHLETLLGEYEAESMSSCLKMTLSPDIELSEPTGITPIRLTAEIADELKEFYDAAYPGNWFEPQMLNAGFYYGLREHGELIAAAGVHVVSPRYRVAALGNVVTAPSQRGRGLGDKLARFVCLQLRAGGIELIGLNVNRDNRAARNIYEKIGFVITTEYEEAMLVRREG